MDAGGDLVQEVGDSLEGVGGGEVSQLLTVVHQVLALGQCHHGIEECGQHLGADQRSGARRAVEALLHDDVAPGGREIRP